jgi:predicted  nucleic acid-binding Zn-ribbon protein
MYHQRLQQKSINPYNSSLSSSNQNASNDPSLHRFYESLHESFRERSKHDQLKYQEEIKQLKTQVEEATKSRMAVQSRLDSLTNENSSLQLKLREFEIEKKY